MTAFRIRRKFESSILNGDPHYFRSEVASRMINDTHNLSKSNRIPEVAPVVMLWRTVANHAPYSLVELHSMNYKLLILNTSLSLLAALQAACSTTPNVGPPPSPTPTPTGTEERAKLIREIKEENQKDFQEEMSELQAKIKRTPALGQAISIFSPVADWRKRLLNTPHPYSVDLAEAMILPNRRPILFLARLEDVARQQTR